MKFSFVIIPLLFFICFNVSAQSQAENLCNIIKIEVGVYKNQKSAGFRFEDLRFSGPQKHALFKSRVAKIIYKTPDSGAKYLNSSKYMQDCLKAVEGW